MGRSERTVLTPSLAVSDEDSDHMLGVVLDQDAWILWTYRRQAVIQVASWSTYSAV